MVTCLATAANALTIQKKFVKLSARMLPNSMELLAIYSEMVLFCTVKGMCTQNGSLDVDSGMVKMMNFEYDNLQAH